MNFGINELFFSPGDDRNIEQPGLTSLHTLFARQHNLLADMFAAARPEWGDERIFQEARCTVSRRSNEI